MEVTRGEKRIPSATFLPPITQGSNCPAPVSVTTCHGQRTVTSPSQVPALRRHRGETRPMRLSRGWLGNSEQRGKSLSALLLSTAARGLGPARAWLPGKLSLHRLHLGTTLTHQDIFPGGAAQEEK